MNQRDLIVRTELKVDLERLLEAFHATRDLPKQHHAVAVTVRPGHADAPREGTVVASDDDLSYRVISDEFRGTYFEEILRALPFHFGRTRLMSIPPQKCYPVHADRTVRYHLAIDTNPFAYIFFPVQKQMFHVPADGHLYRMDATYPHSAVNCGPFQRTHLVVVSDEV